MSDENGNGSGGNQDKSERLRELLHKLQGLVLLHGLPHVRKAVTEKLAELHMAGDRIDLLAKQMRAELMAQGVPAADLDEAEAAARENLEKLGRGDPELTEVVVGEALLEASASIVKSWANVLALFASRGNGLAWLRTSMLGDDMLPLNDKECDEAFAADFDEAESPVDSDVARAILRDIRAALPAGKALPADMIAALDLAWGIVVVP